MTVATYDPEMLDPENQVVSMTEAAIRHFRGKITERNGRVIRLSTETSGCTGYAYVLEYAEAPEAGDTVLHPAEDITLAIAADAVGRLRGTRIDMVTEGINRVVKFFNPNVVSECGCGESFSVAE